MVRTGAGQPGEALLFRMDDAHTSGPSSRTRHAEHEEKKRVDEGVPTFRLWRSQIKPRACSRCPHMPTPPIRRMRLRERASQTQAIRRGTDATKTFRSQLAVRRRQWAALGISSAMSEERELRQGAAAGRQVGEWETGLADGAGRGTRRAARLMGVVQLSGVTRVRPGKFLLVSGFGCAVGGGWMRRRRGKEEGVGWVYDDALLSSLAT